ncbi:ABC transporter G family member 20-like [Hibiscus syriacus]|uniref:ABC transporter G family member 20-like n=1 Tax=Hibiscus syriacus TaxID=106335 RepID=UPI0019234465|nr:ABC transporter G family member 20-like [Hibiscus syriacus]
MFWQLDDSPAGIQERLGCISISIATVFFNCITRVPTFIQERYIFMREISYNAYRRPRLIPDVFLTFVSGIAIIFYFLFLCGFLVARNRLPKYWVWLHYISLIKYPYEAILQNEFLDPMEGYVMGVQLFDQTTVGTLPAPLKSEFLASMGRILGRNITIYCQRRVGGLIGLGLWAVVVGEKVEVLENRVHRINFSQM